MATALTPRQTEVLSFLRAHIAKRGFAPSTGELSSACQLGSPSGAHRMLKMLERKGYIEREPGRSRAITLRDPSQSLRDVDDEELLMISLIVDLQGAARDAVLQQAASTSDLADKGALIRDAVDRQELVERLHAQLAQVDCELPRSHGAIGALVGAIRADASWPVFVVDHLIFNVGSEAGVHRFAPDHEGVGYTMLQVAEISARGAAHAREWLAEILTRTTKRERQELRARARTMLEIQSLSARLIEQHARDEGLFGEAPDESSLPELFKDR